jgi:hypothetical protein
MESHLLDNSLLSFVLAESAAEAATLRHSHKREERGGGPALQRGQRNSRKYPHTGFGGNSQLRKREKTFFIRDRKIRLTSSLILKSNLKILS